MSFFWKYTFAILLMSASVASLAAYLAVKYLKGEKPKNKFVMPTFKHPPPPPPRPLTELRIDREHTALGDLMGTLFNSDLPAVRRDKIIEALLDNMKDGFLKTSLQMDMALRDEEEDVSDESLSELTLEDLKLYKETLLHSANIFPKARWINLLVREAEVVTQEIRIKSKK